MNNKNNGKEIFFALSLFTSLGFSIIFPILVSIYIAGYFQRKYNLSGIVIIIAVFVGIGASVVSVKKLIKMYYKQKEK